MNLLKRSALVCAFVTTQMAFGSAGSSDEETKRCLPHAQEVKDAWLPSHLSPIHRTYLFDRLKSRQSVQTRPYAIGAGLRGTGCFYRELTPFVNVGLNHVHSMCQDGYVPEIVDVGAGDGYHAGLFVLAGGRVTMVENDGSVVNTRTRTNIPNETLQGMLRGLLPAGVHIEDRSCLMMADAVTALATPEQREKYDFANVANVLHMMTPPAALACVKGLYNALKPGGVAHVRVHCLSVLHTDRTEEDVFALYCKRVQEGAAFPGWIGSTRRYLTPYAMASFVPLDEAHPQPPMEMHLKRVATEADGMVTLESKVTFAFDVATLTRLFEGAGFESASIMFEMLDGSLTPVAPGQETFVDALEHPDKSRHHPSLQTSYGALNICYIAKKSIAGV